MRVRALVQNPSLEMTMISLAFRRDKRIVVEARYTKRRARANFHDDHNNYCYKILFSQWITREKIMIIRRRTEIITFDIRGDNQRVGIIVWPVRRVNPYARVCVCVCV